MRNQIIQEATRLFAVRGFDGTSLQEIADAVGIRKPSLLYHFPSKDELRRSVLDAMLARWNDVLPRLLMAGMRDERFDAVMAELISFFRDDPNRARLLVREVLDRPDDMTKRLTSYVRPWLEMIVEQLDKAKQRGDVRPDVDLHAYVIQVINLVVSGIAMSDSLQLLLPGNESAEDGRERQRDELLRMARASLFVAER